MGEHKESGKHSRMGNRPPTEDRVICYALGEHQTTDAGLLDH
jgi:hypothetical protein